MARYFTGYYLTGSSQTKMKTGFFTGGRVKTLEAYVFIFGLKQRTPGPHALRGKEMVNNASLATSEVG